MPPDFSPVPVAVNALCPNCRAAEGEIEDRTRDPDAGLRIDFRCPECDHEWRVTL